MTDPLATLTQKELTVVAPDLNAFFAAVQSPDANYLTVIEAAKNLQLGVLQLSGNAQTVLIHFVFASLQAKLNSLITPTVTVAPATTTAA